MIQRIQSLYLLFSIITLGLFLYMPLMEIDSPGFHDFTRGYDIRYFMMGYIIYVNLILAASAIGCSLLAIFLFKKPGLQKLFCVFGIILTASAAAFVYYRFQTRIFFGDVIYTWWNLLALAAAVFMVLAFMGVKKDEELLRSVDRLR